ncbi:MAG: hypothetical protein C0P68_003985 [Bacillota bacterium]|nr:hypothetical protein [Bacillota bacterium]
MRWWEWLKKGWQSYTEAVQVELMAYLPAWDESGTEPTAANSVVYNDHQDETKRGSLRPEER